MSCFIYIITLHLHLLTEETQIHGARSRRSEYSINRPNWTHSSFRIFNIGVLWACRLMNGTLWVLFCPNSTWKLNKMDQLKAYENCIYILGYMTFPRPPRAGSMLQIIPPVSNNSRAIELMSCHIMIYNTRDIELMSSHNMISIVIKLDLCSIAFLCNASALKALIVYAYSTEVMAIIFMPVSNVVNNNS